MPADGIDEPEPRQRTEPATLAPTVVPASGGFGRESEAALAEPVTSSVPRGQGPGGRPPIATLEQLAEVIGAAHPDPDAITRESARKALTASGLGAGTVRLTEAITLVRRAARADEQPDEGPSADRT